MIEITITVLQIEITTIEIDSTILVITVGDIITQMVSSWIGAIVRIITQINIKTGNFKAITIMTIKETTQITITIRLMVGTRGLSMVEKIQYRNQQQNYENNQPRQNYGHQKPAFSGNDHNKGHSNYKSTSSFSDVSSFVTRYCVTFDPRRNQGFPNTCTVK